MKTWKTSHVRSNNFLESELNKLEAEGWTIFAVLIDTIESKLNFRINIVAYKEVEK